MRFRQAMAHWRRTWILQLFSLPNAVCILGRSGGPCARLCQRIVIRKKTCEYRLHKYHSQNSPPLTHSSHSYTLALYMTSTFGDNVTVVDDSAPYKGLDDTISKSSGSQPPKNKSRIAFTGKARVPHESEFTTVDYNIEERPFFIPIGKAGVIAALEKLDRQLLDVRIQYLVERVLNSSFYCRRTGQGCFRRRSPLTGLDVKLFPVKLV